MGGRNSLKCCEDSIFTHKQNWDSVRESFQLSPSSAPGITVAIYDIIIVTLTANLRACSASTGLPVWVQWESAINPQICMHDCVCVCACGVCGCACGVCVCVCVCVVREAGRRGLPWYRPWWGRPTPQGQDCWGCSPHTTHPQTQQGHRAIERGRYQG